ncbi:hypothetical protein [Pandoraea apista]|uniref:hypothetical protein n=1 Tax=Pandoraea apista TaxID=93218 RepID=UPI001240B4C2|nr:hypothetical protein [Pandoraea apista]
MTYNDNHGPELAAIAKAHGIILLGFGERANVGDVFVNYSERGMYGVYLRYPNHVWKRVFRRKDFAAVCRAANRYCT